MIFIGRHSRHDAERRDGVLRSVTPNSRICEIMIHAASLPMGVLRRELEGLR